MIELNEYDLTLFNRGKTNPNLFPDIKRIVGDRNTDDITKIGDSKWDCIIDLSCYYPDSLEKIINQINGNADRYIFISTCSVYDQDINKSGLLLNENDKILDCKIDERKDKRDITYGKRKAECERILQSTNWLDKIILRPALVYGEYDYTDRFYYWLYKVKTQNQILIPDKGETTRSSTYVKDLIRAIIDAIHIDKHSIVYNITTYPNLSIDKIIKTASEILDLKPKTINATPEFLNQNDISQLVYMPLWIDGEHFTYDNLKIIKDFKIQFIDFITSIADTISYYDKLRWKNPKFGMKSDKERELIKKLTSANR